MRKIGRERSEGREGDEIGRGVREIRRNVP